MVVPRNISFNVLDLDSLCERMFQCVGKDDGLSLGEHMKKTRKEYWSMALWQ
jgi:hypothetical protein